MSQRVPTQAALIADIQKLQRKHPGVSLTRNFYRSNGTFSESLWQAHFPKFSDYLAAAGIASTEPETDQTSGDTRTISLPKTRIHTLDQLLSYCKVDLAVWEVDRFLVNKWEMNSGGGNVEPLYQVKAQLKKRSEMIFARNEIAELKKLAKADARVPKSLVRPSVMTGNMLEINIPDAHFGKLAWSGETGYENYDTKIAEAMFTRALDTIIARATSGYRFDEIVFVVGNDLFNSDDTESRTTKGTVVTTDGRYHKVFYRVRKTITNAIERLRRIAPVRVIMVSGNHDNLSVWHLGDSLECYFAKYDDVTIDNEPKPRKYHQHGKVMLMFTHGDKGRRQDYPLLMATEKPELFGATMFREAHCGHTHMTKLDEQHGVRVRVLPALCPPDDWHAENGYVGNLRNAEGYIWNKDEGLVAQVYYNDNAQAAITTKREIVQ